MNLEYPHQLNSTQLKTIPPTLRKLPLSTPDSLSYNTLNHTFPLLYHTPAQLRPPAFRA